MKTLPLSVLTSGKSSSKKQPRLRKKTNIPIPIELIVVILGTAASYFGNLNENFDLLIVGDIPTG